MIWTYEEIIKKIIAKVPGLAQEQTTLMIKEARTFDVKKQTVLSKAINRAFPSRKETAKDIYDKITKMSDGEKNTCCQ